MSRNKISITQENNLKMNALDEDQKKTVKRKLIRIRLGSIAGLSLMTLPFGFLIGPILWILFLIFFIDRYFIKWAINSTEKQQYSKGGASQEPKA